MNVYVLRMSHVKDLIQEGLNSNEIIIGWSDAQDLINNSHSWLGFRGILYKTYGQSGQNYRKAGNSAGSMWRFIREMQIGDLVVIPWQKNFYVAEVTGHPRYDQKYKKYDTAYRREVEWLNDKNPIPKKNLGNLFQAKFKAHQTCTGPFDLFDDIKAVIVAEEIKRERIVNACVEKIINALDKDCFIGNKASEKGRSSGVKLSPRGQEIIEGMEPHPDYIQECEEGIDVLGTYHPMTSPGVITIHVSKLTSFFWHHIADILSQGHHISWRDLEYLAYMVTILVYKHEQFHHFCDVAQHLFSGRYNYLRNTEEALAVANTYLEISIHMRTKKSSKIGMISKTVYQEMLEKIYRFSQPGYRDWVNYKTLQSYQAGLIKYIKPHSSELLGKNGISVAGILDSINNAVKYQGVIEQLKP